MHEGRDHSPQRARLETAKSVEQAFAPEIKENAAERALRAMTKARSMLVLEHPFFGSLALRLQIKADPDCGDLWTDGKSLAFNPAYADALSDAALIGAQAHEIIHLACGHHVRRGGRDEKLWNQACDHAVNLILKDSGFTLPTGFVCDEKFAGQSVESIYDTLARLQENEPNEGAKNALEKGPGAADAASGNSGSQEGDETDKAQPPKTDKNSKEPNAGDTRLGEDAAAGKQNELKHKKKKEALSFRGEVRDHPALESGAESHAAAKAKREADMALAQALHRADKAGDIPAGLTRLLREAVTPRLDWRSVLQRFLENCSGGDFSWTTPNRRYIEQDLYLPSLRVPQIPELVLAVDASGSIDDPALALFCAELSSILEAYDTRITVLYHDTKVQGEQSFGRSDLPFTLRPVGGGGTDFRPVCEYIEERGLRPACLLWFTDMQCNHFPEEPPYPVLWAVTDEPLPAPPFGQVLRLSAY